MDVERDAVLAVFYLCVTDFWELDEMTGQVEKLTKQNGLVYNGLKRVSSKGKIKRTR